MDEPRELRKFPRGERCPECGVRKWYLENGMRFCARGHQVEGFIQFDVGEEADAGRLGSVARREKETREKELRHLGGQAGKNLYLESLQLILRSQLLWLIVEKSHPEELETIVRDLWDLRIRGSSNLVSEEDTAEGNLELFSSQAFDEERTEGASKRRARAQSWDPERGSDWPMPRMVDTLALCYLGCLLLKIPTRIGELFNWANGGYIPYRRSYYNLPPEMQDRLPSAYTRALKMTLHTPLRGGNIHNAVLDLALSYRLNYDMVFPAINSVPVMIQYARHLALPVEVVVVIRRISTVMGQVFHLPIHKSRVFPLDHPEVWLIAGLVVAIKLCFPFHGRSPHLGRSNLTGTSTLDWHTWQENLDEGGILPRAAPNQPNFEACTSNQVACMTTEELDAYLAHVATVIDRRRENPVAGFFPVEHPPDPVPPTPEDTEQEVQQKARQVLRQIIRVRPEDDAEDNKASAYEAYRELRDLSDFAKAFYTAAAHLAGITLPTLVQAVYMLEQRILVWQRGSTTAGE